MLTYVCGLQPALILSIVILPHLSWQTLEEEEEELEAPSANEPDTSSSEGSTETNAEAETESSGGDLGGMSRESIEHGTEKKMVNVENEAPSENYIENGHGGGEAQPISDVRFLKDLQLRDEKNAMLTNEMKTDTTSNDSVEKVSELKKIEDDVIKSDNVEEDDLREGNATIREDPESQQPIQEDSNFPEELSITSCDEDLRTEHLEENEWSLLTQWSEGQRSFCEGDDNQRKISFNSDTDGESEGNTYHSYVNYGLDDSDILQDLTDPPHLAGHVHPPEEAVHLDTIQESDESEEDDDEYNKKITMPSLLKSKLSAGMFNLHDISSDGTGEADVTGESSEDIKNEQHCSEDLGKHSSASFSDEKDSSSSSDSENEAQKSAGAEATGNESQRRLKKGRITKKKKGNPIFLSGDLRTFSNPISYLGGPTIEYDEGNGDGRVRHDSLTSTTSLD